MSWQDAEKVKQAAYVMSQAACGLIRAMGMTALNQDRLSKGHTIGYDDEAFEALITEFNIHHNAVVAALKVE